MSISSGIYQSDCLEGLKSVESASVDLVYLDPPFFTNRSHKLSQRGGGEEFSFDDLWAGHANYAEFLHKRCRELRRVLKDTGSIFFHCNKNANYIVRIVLDDIFDEDNFQSEIIWSYKRWSNSKKGLLPAHQTILFYSKSKDFKFNKIYTEYSESTNVDQILQIRSRNRQGKSAYARDKQGAVIINANKKGVPLNDVWDIPYLNPKAKERVGYPTQKPLLLLDRIISLVTDDGDTVLDPFAGSGTTLVAAKLINRKSIGFDISADAVRLAKERLKNPVKTESALLNRGRQAYSKVDKYALSLLEGLDFVPVHRNKGIDVILKQTLNNNPILVRVQRNEEALSEAAQALFSAMQTKAAGLGILVRRNGDMLFDSDCFPSNLRVVDAVNYSIKKLVADLKLSTPCGRRATSRT